MTSKIIAAKIKEFENTPCYRGMLQLFETSLQEARVRNDVAVDPEFYRNQGAIQELRRLIKLTGPREIQKGYDGAYGE